MRIRRPFRLAIAATAVVTIVAVIVWNLWSCATERKVRHAIESLRADGYAVSPATIYACGSESNDAAELYRQAFAKFMSSSDLSANPRELSFDSLTNEQRSGLQLLFQRHADAFETLRRARLKGDCRFARNYDTTWPDAPEAGPALVVAGWLALRAQMLGQQGSNDNAIEATRDIFALAMAFKEEPTHLSQTTMLGISDIAIFTVYKCVAADTDLSESDVLEWLSTVPNMAVLDRSVEWAIRGEVARVAWLLEDLSRLESQSAGVHGDLCSRIGRRVSAPLVRSESLVSLARLQQMVACLRLSYPRSREAIVSICPPDVLRRRFDLGAASFLGMDSLLEMSVTVRSALAVTRTGLEWEIAFIRGRHPEAAGLPMGPSTDRPLVYDAARRELSAAGPLPQSWMRSHGLVWKLHHR